MSPYYSDPLVTLYLGDCREVTAWLEADVLVTDPPYGISWQQNLSGYSFRGYERTPDKDHYGIQNDEDTSARDAILERWGTKRPALVFGSPRMAPPLGTRHVLTWKKPIDAGLIGSWLPWRRDTESIYVIGAWPKAEAKVSSVIDGPTGMRSYLAIGEDRHPHAKPVRVIESLILQCPPGVIADPFAGSGTTLRAAKNLGRQAIGVEIEERYCEIAAKRLAQESLWAENRTTPVARGGTAEAVHLGGMDLHAGPLLSDTSIAASDPTVARARVNAHADEGDHPFTPRRPA